MNNIKYKYLLTFLFISAFIIYTINYIGTIRLSKFVEAEETLIGTTYKSILNEYSTHSKILFENVINKQEVLSIFSEASTNPTKAREKLFNKLNPMYENMLTFKLRQLHFHLKNNDSFLRFHRPSKYGDNLSSVRASVVYANKYKECVSGFEEGRILNGFRFVCPLSYQDVHIGSVETSISMNSIIYSLSKVLDAKVEFILDDYVVKEKVFKSELSNYKKYTASANHVVEKDVKESEIINKILKQDIELNKSRLGSAQHKDVLSFYAVLDDKSYMLSIIYVKRALSDETVAHFIVLREQERLSFFNIQEKMIMLILIILVWLVMFFMYKSQKKKITIEEQNKKLLLSEKKFKKLLDLQKNIMVVTDGHHIKMANDAMCTFFGVDYLEFFTKHYDDISDRFIESDLYFNMQKIPKNLTWIESIEGLVGDKKIVVMHDSNDDSHAFHVSVSKYEGDDFMVLFTDISDTMIEKKDLRSKVFKDTLTGAYSREFFNTQIKTIVKNIPKSESLGVAILDIDLFKNVNDTYGHDVGDTILVELTTLVKDTIREYDFFIRWGGEEFIILLKISNGASLSKALEHIRKRIEAYKFSSCSELTCSIGATIHQSDEDIKESIKRADDALYVSKENGRNRLTIL